jgi:NAD(P)-dependent dehydrogenase (short-subunit alcohol dehydrogenase family)
VAACQRVAEELLEKSYQAAAYRLDLSDEESVRDFVDNLYTDAGRIDVLVNNAVSRPLAGCGDSFAKWQESMRTNAAGVFLLTRLAAERMMERGGSIINIASIQGMVGPDLNLYEGLGMAPLADYFFHRAGMLNLTRYFAAVYGSRGIRVNCISPGGLLDEDIQPPLFIERYSAKTFLGRMAQW